MYDDYRGEHVITMIRAAPEWCNSDCPSIIMVQKDPPVSIRVNSGTFLETSNLDIASQFASFFAVSVLAYYRKYDYPIVELRNSGFWINFVRDNTRIYGRSFVKCIVPEEQKEFVDEIVNSSDLTRHLP